MVANFSGRDSSPAAFARRSAVWAFFIEPNRLIVHYETITIDSWPQNSVACAIAMIGDVHTDNHYVNEAKLQRIVDLTNVNILICCLAWRLHSGRPQ
jgi:hypothetical protein